jgi:flagellar assembly factor FliW
MRRDIETPLGLVKEEDVRPLHFPRGLIGFAQERAFGLCAFPQDQLPQFLFLKCFNRPDLSFIVLPFHTESALMREQDLQYLAESVAVDFKHALFFALITIREKDGVRGFFANLRAPLVVNPVTSEAWQAVWPQNSYSIRHPIAVISEQGASQPKPGPEETAMPPSGI